MSNTVPLVVIVTGEVQTMSYIVNTCHRTRFAGGLEAQNGADADAANYLDNISSVCTRQQQLVGIHPRRGEGGAGDWSWLPPL